MTALSCPCGRAFDGLTALDQHQRAKGHLGMTRTDFGFVDLPNRRADDPSVEDFHKIGIAITAVAARFKAGEHIDVDKEAENLGILSLRLVRALRAHGAVIPEIAA